MTRAQARAAQWRAMANQVPVTGPLQRAVVREYERRAHLELTDGRRSIERKAA